MLSAGFDAACEARALQDSVGQVTAALQAHSSQLEVLRTLARVVQIRRAESTRDTVIERAARSATADALRRATLAEDAAVLMLQQIEGPSPADTQRMARGALEDARVASRTEAAAVLGADPQATADDEWQSHADARDAAWRTQLAALVALEADAQKRCEALHDELRRLEDSGGGAAEHGHSSPAAPPPPPQAPAATHDAAATAAGDDGDELRAAVSTLQGAVAAAANQQRADRDTVQQLQQRAEEAAQQRAPEARQLLAQHERELEEVRAERQTVERLLARRARAGDLLEQLQCVQARAKEERRRKVDASHALDR
eukprot:g6859.t1